MKYRKLTQAELLSEAMARFGDDPMKFAFQCPSCGDVATIAEFKDAGDADVAGQMCIGRVLGPLDRPRNRTRTKFKDRGCDWAAFGLFRGPWEIVVPAEDGRPERSVWSFPLAGAASA